MDMAKKKPLGPDKTGLIRIAVGSLNPVKLEGVRLAASRAFPKARTEVLPVDADSAVGDQPVGFDEIWTGAGNRAKGAHGRFPDADYCVGLESGLIEFGERYFDIQFCALYDGKRMSAGCSMGFPLPPKVREGIFGKGKESGRRSECGGKADGCGCQESPAHPRENPRRSLGHVVSGLAGVEEIGKKGGAIDFLSRGLLHRREMVEQAFLCALIERRSPV